MPKRPGLFRQIAVFVYDSLLMLALLGFATFLFIWMFGDATQGLMHLALQLFLWTIAGIYFVYSWYRRGQTLAMKTWRVRLVHIDGTKPSLVALIQRYILASFSLLFFASGFIWAWIDREHCSLHDRLLGFRLYMENTLSTADAVKHNQTGQ